MSSATASKMRDPEDAAAAFGESNNLGSVGFNDEHHGPNGNGHLTRPKAHHKEDAVIDIQPIRRADMQPSFAQEIASEEVNSGWYGNFYSAVGDCIGLLGSLPFCFCCPNPYKQVPQGSVGLITRWGQAIRSVDPGLARVNPCSESIRITNVQLQISPLPQQQVLTRDNVKIQIESVLSWSVKNPYRATFLVQDVRLALIERAQTTMRHVMGSRNLQSVIADREAVAAEIQEIVAEVSEAWGVTCESILIKDILLDAETQSLLASAATQRRLGESKIIAARAEVESAKLMRAAADILSSPAAMQIRQLETWTHMSKQANSKVIFVPITHVSNDPGSLAKTLNQGAAQGNPATTDTAAATSMPHGDLQNVAQIGQLASM